MSRLLPLALALCGFLAAVAPPAPAQDIVTAQEFFGMVSAKLAGIKDYSCDFAYTREQAVSSGRMYYRAPNLLRLDYSTPKGQVVLMDGQKLQILIPSLSLILEQAFPKGAPRPDLASERSLRLLSENYDIAYLDTPDPVPIDEGAKELVTRLKLTRRSPNEMYREIILSIAKDHTIRRWEGELEDRTSVVMDYTNMRLNQNIPASRFRDEAWPEANVYPDFLTGGD